MHAESKTLQDHSFVSIPHRSGGSLFDDLQQALGGET